jgi:HD-like signal output (HDOD) protein
VSNSETTTARARRAALDATVDEFARGVLADIERGQEPLPVWSKDVRRVLDELATPKPSTARLSQLVALDARLAVTTMHIAQSVSFGRLATPSLDLQQTIFALGPERLLAIVVGAGMAQLPELPRLQQRRRELQAVGGSSLRASAICMLAAPRMQDIDIAAAFLLGMLHGVGKYALYARLREAGDWREDTQQRLLLLSRWHARIGAAMVRQWALPAWLAAAVESQDQLGRQPEGDLRGELLAAAVVAARTAHAIDETAGHLAEFSRTGLDRDAWRAVLKAVPATTDALRSLLYG